MTNWIYNGVPFDPPYDEINHAGFCYCITNTLNNRKYIGKKVFHARRTLKPLKGKSRNRKIVKESDWRTYQSSCEELIADIEKHGEEKFIFEILSFHVNRKEIDYHELILQFMFDVLEARDESGQRKFYNKNISNKYYPSELHWESRLSNKELYFKLLTSWE